MYIHKLISEHIPYAKPEDTGLDVMAKLEENKVEHIAVVRGDYYVGILSEDELMEMPNPEDVLETIKYATAKPHVKPDQHVFDVLKVMYDNHLTVVPVIDNEEKYLGSIAIQDLVMQLATLMSAEVPGGVVILEVNEPDYMLSQIARIVEENDAKILSVFVENVSTTAKLEITLKINKVQIDDIIQSFNRFDYDVKATFHQSAFTDEIKDRYDGLMKYLDL